MYLLVKEHLLLKIIVFHHHHSLWVWKGASTVPSAYIHDHEEVTAVINGMYYGKDGKSMGIAYANGEEYANGDKKQVTGYFSISKSGKVRITESLSNKKNYNFVIGTRPLLVTESEVNYQAKKERYAGPAAYRSAIDVKEGNVCFAVSEHPVKMQKWAELLQRAGYSGALNLDGGPVSEFAVREDKVKSYGPGNLNTQLVIFASRSD
jgi:uncharacterized protein YigE (DUF2233 family)